MLYGNESISHFTRSNIIIWMSMAMQAGVLNMGAFMAGHKFVSHITGFATFFGFELSQRRPDHAFGMLVVPLFFLFGSVISGFLVDLRLKLHIKPKYYISFGLIFAILLLVLVGGALGAFGEFGGEVTHGKHYLPLVLVCLVCGIQNGTITTVSRSVVRTTHLTGITTDLGIGIVRVLNRNKIKEDLSNEGRANLVRVGLIFFFVLGSVLGGLVFKNMGYLGFIFPVLTSGILFGLMWHFQVRKQST